MLQGLLCADRDAWGPGGRLLSSSCRVAHTLGACLPGFLSCSLTRSCQRYRVSIRTTSLILWREKASCTPRHYEQPLRSAKTRPGLKSGGVSPLCTNF
jgi:hypothetical protein